MLPSVASARHVVQLASSSRAVIRCINNWHCGNALRHHANGNLIRTNKALHYRVGVRTMAYVPEVDVTQYEDQLDAKVQRVKQLFADHKSLPEIEVCLNLSEQQQIASAFFSAHVYHMLTVGPLSHRAANTMQRVATRQKLHKPSQVYQTMFGGAVGISEPAPTLPQQM